MLRRRDWRALIQYGVIFFLLEKLGAVVGTTNLGLDRFDEQGHSKLAADPVALPFPEMAPGQAPGKLGV